MDRQVATACITLKSRVRNSVWSQPMLTGAQMHNLGDMWKLVQIPKVNNTTVVEVSLNVMLYIPSEILKSALVKYPSLK